MRYLTGHCRADGDLDFDWDGLADPATTLVVYMGLASIAEIAGKLMAHGRAACTPVIAVSKATRRDESRLVAMLGSVASAVEAADLEGPVLFVIGEVVSLTQQFGVHFDALQVDPLAAAE